MPDKRAHRGPHPDDQKLFGAEHIERLRAAVTDVSWLLTRGYAESSALRIVGDHYQLALRQRTAVMRCACADHSLEQRARRRVGAETLRGRELLLDGYNVLTTIEAALAGGVVLLARDGCLRDMASMHGSFRKVQETAPAAALLGHAIQQLAVGSVTWYLDAPVSNSGRLKSVLQAKAELHHWPWNVQVVPSPDAVLSRSSQIIATADSVVLDRCGPWFNLTHHVIATAISGVWTIDLSKNDSAPQTNPGV